MTTSIAEKTIPQQFAHGQLQLAVPRGAERPAPPTHQEIARRAYDIYVADHRTKGRCTANWHQAEQQLIHESQSAPKTKPQYGN